MRCWHGHLFEVRCRWFAYMVQMMPQLPPSFLPSLTSRMIYLAGAGIMAYAGRPRKEAVKWAFACSYVVIMMNVLQLAKS